MKKKTVFLLASVVFIILAVYAVWHYSPLRHITQSKSDDIQTASLGAENQPVIIRKKIPPRPKAAVQETDIPQPLIDQLKPGGRMVLPVGMQWSTQGLTLVTRDADGEIKKEVVMAVGFVPLTRE